MIQRHINCTIFVCVKFRTSSQGMFLLPWQPLINYFFQVGLSLIQLELLPAHYTLGNSWLLCKTMVVIEML